MKTKSRIYLPLIAIWLLLLAIAASAGNHKHHPLQQQIDSLVELNVPAGQPGGAVAVIHRGEVIHQQAYGMQDLEKGIANEASTMFDLASVAKQFTGFAILLLEQDGLIDLDENIRHYLPEMPGYAHTISVRHLLQHTSGLASTDLLRLFADKAFDEEWSQEDEFNIIKNYPQLNFPPNTQHTYSNAGYSLLAQVVESVAGMPFTAFMQQRIFRPLGMESSMVYTGPPMDIPRLAKGYGGSDEGFKHISSISDYSYGAGNIFSNLSDMTRWGQHLLDPKAGDAALVQRMFNKYNTLENGDSISYTYGFQVRNYRGVKLVEHSGGLPGFRSRVQVFPEEELVVIVLLNNQTINSFNLSMALARLFLEDRLQEPEPPQPREAIALKPEKATRFEGTYLLEDGMEMIFFIENDTFWLELPGDTRFRLHPESETSFFLKEFDAGCHFVVEPEGDVNQMTWRQNGRDFPARRVSEAQALTTEQLRQFAGVYFQSYLLTEYPIIFDEGKLEMQFPATFSRYMGFETLQLNHIRDDRFDTGALGLMEFTRDADGQVNGFVINNVGRLSSIPFTRK